MTVKSNQRRARQRRNAVRGIEKKKTVKPATVKIADIGAVAARVIAHPDDHRGKTYTLTGPASVSMETVAAELGEVLGKQVAYVATPAEATREALVGNGMPAWVADALVEYGDAYAGGWGDFVTTAVADITGRQARTVVEFSRDHAPAFNGS